MSEIKNPLVDEPVIDRDISQSFKASGKNSLFSDPEEDEELMKSLEGSPDEPDLGEGGEEMGNPLGAGSEAPPFMADPDSPPEPDIKNIHDAGGDFSFGSDAEREQAAEISRNSGIKMVLDTLDVGLPWAVSEMTRINVKEIHTYVQAGSIAPNTEAICIEKNKDDAALLQTRTHWILIRMEKPLREVAQGNDIDIKPEWQLAFYCILLVGVTIYTARQINQGNADILKEIRKNHRQYMRQHRKAGAEEEED